MAKFLFTWELGGGNGHLMSLRPLAERLSLAGHEVAVAVRNLLRARQAFAGLPVRCFQAPVKIGRADDRIDLPRTFADILHNTGFSKLDELQGLAGKWRELFGALRPDAIVADHSPTALLAARACGIRRAVVGTGFFCPPDQRPLPDLRPWLPASERQMARVEDRVLRNANQILVSFGGRPLERVSQLVNDVELNVLATFRELDPYPERTIGQYTGAWPNIAGKTPNWPVGTSKKVFVYVRPFPALGRLLQLLNELNCRAIVHVPGLGETLRPRFESARVRFEMERLDLSRVGGRCDLAILNGGHGTTVSMLLAGTPTLQLPVYLEQALTGQAVARFGAGRCASVRQPKQLGETLPTMLSSDKYGAGARRFAARYAGYSAARQVESVATRIERLAA